MQFRATNKEWCDKPNNTDIEGRLTDLEFNKQKLKASFESPQVLLGLRVSDTTTIPQVTANQKRT